MVSACRSDAPILGFAYEFRHFGCFAGVVGVLGRGSWTEGRGTHDVISGDKHKYTLHYTLYTNMHFTIQLDYTVMMLQYSW